jgi:hypothetical protein
MDGSTEAPVIAEQSVKTDFYLKLPSEADMPTALTAFYRQDHTVTVDPETGEQVYTPDGDPYLVMNTPDYAIDVVGIIMDPTGVILTDAEGNEYPEMAPLPGWHINMRLSGEARRADVEALDAAYGVTPTSPRRVWL